MKAEEKPAGRFCGFNGGFKRAGGILVRVETFVPVEGRTIGDADDVKFALQQ
ncbi:hypothetical protein Barb7_02950 [Bacteroidales bacterium Barb7]|nr:hypothetical protein Barb7_02950 [Bacteroidales bacterium Barb7]